MLYYNGNYLLTDLLRLVLLNQSFFWGGCLQVKSRLVDRVQTVEQFSAGTCSLFAVLAPYLLIILVLRDCYFIVLFVF